MVKDDTETLPVARTPAKLRNNLVEQHSIPASTLDSLLTIYGGDAKDVSAVSKTLISPVNRSALVDTIYTGIGSTPVLQASLMTPVTLVDPTICQAAMQVLFAAISSLQTLGVSATADGKKPLLIFISSTGITKKKRDVPLPLVPLYYWTLKIPHDDKAKTEALALNDRGRHVRDCVIVRPTLLTDAVMGIESVRAGWEWGALDIEGKEEGPGPALGWSVGRRDVGEWVFRKCIVEGGWEGRCVSLTY
jgi:hypothetical protein